MKKIFVCIVLLSCLAGANAQKAHVVAVYRPVYLYSPSFGIGYYAPFYGYYGNPYWNYPYGMHQPVSKMEKAEAEIKSDFADRIHSVRKDDSLSKEQKRASVRALKKERKQEIKDLVANYHKQPKNDNATQ